MFEASLREPNGHGLGVHPCRDLSHGGLFVCAAEPYPALNGRVIVHLPPELGLELAGEIVRHVGAPQAAAWGMPPGFAVQFAPLTAAQKERIDDFLRGKPVPPVRSAPSRVAIEDSPAVALLSRYADVPRGDHYALLSLAPGDDFDVVRSRGRHLHQELTAALTEELTDGMRAALESLAERVHVATEVLRHPTSRLDYDAGRRNHEGIARCLAVGLPNTVIAEARKRFLAGHPGAEANGTVRSMMAHAFEMKQDLPHAFEQYRMALQADPLNPVFQQRYWTLKKQLNA
jgi:serine/threonine-protein kinase